MSKPAARIGDMHVCPMVTPGLPPIPHVGGAIMGPGVPTVLIGNMPAAVMGDMCMCVGPPDSIILGSTGVLIGSKPAARMGDMTAHGGSIVLGCPTVLIGEISPGTVMTKTSLTILEQFVPEAAETAQQVLSMQQAADAGTPFCEVCGEMTNESPTEEEEAENIEEKEVILEIAQNFDEQIRVVDKDGNPISNVLYCFENSGKIILTGRTNNEGYTDRIPTENTEKEYQYYWGDEALKRLNNG